MADKTKTQYNFICGDLYCKVIGQDEIYLYSRFIEENYVEYRYVLPDEIGNKIVFNTAQVVSVLKKIIKMLPAKNKRCAGIDSIILTENAGKFSIHFENKDEGFSQDFPLDAESETGARSLNKESESFFLVKNSRWSSCKENGIN